MQGLLCKYPKIFKLGHPENDGILNEVIVCESKVDGANFRVRYLPDEDKLIFGSRNNELNYNTDPIQWKAVGAFRKAFEEHKDKFISNVVYFAESMQKHTISYDNIPDCVGYDIFDLERNEFYHWKAAKAAFEQIGIPFVHVHFEKPGREVNIDDFIKIIKEQSPYRKAGDEGVILKCYHKVNIYGRPLFAKIVDPLFKEENKKVFKGGAPPTVKSNEVEIIDKYFTDNRFMKAIYRFKEGGETIDMPLIPKLFTYIVDDILSENILDIMKEYNNINYKTLNGIAAKVCVKKLKEYLIIGQYK